MGTAKFPLLFFQPELGVLCYAYSIKNYSHFKISVQLFKINLFNIMNKKCCHPVKMTPFLVYVIISLFLLLFLIVPLCAKMSLDTFRH